MYHLLGRLRPLGKFPEPHGTPFFWDKLTRFVANLLTVFQLKRTSQLAQREDCNEIILSTRETGWVRPLCLQHPGWRSVTKWLKKHSKLSIIYPCCIMQEPQAEAHGQAPLCSPHWPQMSAHGLAASPEGIHPFSPQAPFYGEGWASGLQAR